MDDERIERALRVGPPDEPLYVPQRLRPAPAPRIGRARPRATIGGGPVGASRLSLLAIGLAVVALVVALAHPTINEPTMPGEAGSLVRILTSGTVRVGYISTWPDSGRFGFDVDVAREVARRLGVGLDLVKTTDASVTAGGWVGSFDLAIASTVVSPAASSILRLTSPYYYLPARVTADSSVPAKAVADLAGRIVCVRAGGPAERWLEGVLDVTSATPIVAPPESVTIERQPSDAECIGHPGLRDRDALVTERPLPAPGTSLRLVGGPVFTEQLAIALDGAAADPALLARLDAILADMRADGTLAGLSVKDFGVDLSTAPAP